MTDLFLTEEEIAKASESILGLAEALEKDANGETTPTSRLLRLIGPTFIAWILREQVLHTKNGEVLTAAANIIGFLTAYTVFDCPDDGRQTALDQIGDTSTDMLNYVLKVLDDMNRIHAEPAGHA